MPDTPFPAARDFLGGYQRRSGPAVNGGQSTYTGTIVVSVLPRAVVAAALPADPALALATPRGNLDVHPVIHLIGRQQDLHDLVEGVVVSPVTALPDYQEMILLVPFVVRAGDSQWHNYAARMYLDNQAAVIGGNGLYAYAKELATLTQGGGGWHVAKGTTGYFVNEVQPVGAWRHAREASQTLPRWHDLVSFFAMPVLGCDPLRVLCSYFEWSLAHAEVAPVSSAHAFLQPFRPGMDGFVAAGTLHNAPDGALAVRNVRWRLAVPALGC